MAENSNQYLQGRFNWQRLYRASVPSLVLFFIYYVISLLELWVFVPDFVQVISYFFVIVSGLIFFFAGFLGKISVSERKMRLRLGVLAIGAVIVSLVNVGDLARLNSLAFMPRALFGYPEAIITAEMIPPHYLGEDPVRKEVGRDGDGINPVYEGSMLDVRVSGLRWQPDIELSDGSRVPFTDVGEGIYKASVMIDQQTRWSIKQGAYIIGSWPIQVIDDRNPTIEIFSLEEGHENEKGYLALNVHVKDDRKIMKAVIDIINKEGEKSDQKELSLREVGEYENIFYLDLTGSDVAGSAVNLLMSVEDEAGQVSTQTIENVFIQEKQYKNPLAYNLISLHEELRDTKRELKPLARRIKALGLLPDAGLPPVYYMALRSAYWRLVDPTNPNDRETARNLLWDVAQKIENGELGTIENDLIYSLEELALGIRQQKPLEDIRDLLRNTDNLFREYRRSARLSTSEQYPLDIDLRALRRLYSYILAFSDQGKHRNASLIVDYMRKGLVQNDDLILSRDGLGNYFALFEGRQILDNLIEIQKTLLASSYNDQMKIKMIENTNLKSFGGKSEEARSNEIILQTKVGDAVERLGEKISFTDDYSGLLIENAKNLINDILTNMKKSETNRVARSQSELLAVMSNLKRILNKPVSGAPELRNLLKEISAKPVS